MIVFDQILYFVQFALPHILGWDRLTGQVGTAAQGITSLPKTDPMQLELEWVK